MSHQLLRRQDAYFRLCMSFFCARVSGSGWRQTWFYGAHEQLWTQTVVRCHNEFLILNTHNVYLTEEVFACRQLKFTWEYQQVIIRICDILTESHRNFCLIFWLVTIARVHTEHFPISMNQHAVLPNRPTMLHFLVRLCAHMSTDSLLTQWQTLKLSLTKRKINFYLIKKLESGQILNNKV